MFLHLQCTFSFESASGCCLLVCLCVSSLQCVKKHKEDVSCSGVRNKTAFVTLSEFDEMALLSGEHLLPSSPNMEKMTFIEIWIIVPLFVSETDSHVVVCPASVDYRFLEDTGRFADGASRDTLVQVPRTTFKVSPASVCRRDGLS